MKVKCPFSTLCKYCDNYYSNICCLYKTYSESDFKTCKKIGLCPNLNLCQTAMNGNLIRMSLFNKIIPDLEDAKSIRYHVNKPFEGFNIRFIPRVDIYGENSKNQISIIKKLGIDTIAISLNRIISNKEEKIIKSGFKSNLHDKLDFDGNILLQTNIPDCYCIKIMENAKEYINNLNILKPDIITTFDANFYLDQPLFATSIQTVNILKSNLLISNINIPQIFLIPPAPEPFFKSIFEVFLKSNHKTICIPLGEFTKSKNSYALKLIKYINQQKQIANKDFEVLLISKNPDKKMIADCYSSHSWAKMKKKDDNTNIIKKMESNLKKCLKKAKTTESQKSLFDFIKKR
ncbi:hypothetical protein ES703_125909 [subsurface metagenome]